MKPILLTLLALASPLAASTIQLQWFNGSTNPNVSLQAEITKLGNDSLVKISNLSTGSTTQPTITKIFFTSPVPVNYADDSGAGVEFVYDPGLNLPGGNIIDFIIDFSYGATNPVASKGVDPAESISFLVSNFDVEQAIQDHRFSIAVHAQEIDGASGSFVVPEPSAIFLGALGGLFGLRRKRTSLK